MRRLRCILAGLVLIAGACGGDPPASDDAATFCSRLDRLTRNDPFLAFGERATPADIQVAFDALVERADELLDAAPDEARASALDYAESAAALNDLLAAAGYDGTAVDARAYRDEQTRYAQSAARLERYLGSEC